MNAAAVFGAQAALQVEYLAQPPERVFAQPDVLAVFAFGAAAPRHDDPRYLRVPLEPHGATSLEVWRAVAPVACGRDDGIAWSEDGALQFGAIELEEAELDGAELDEARRFDADNPDALGAIAQQAYRRLLAVTRERGYPHLLRVWNYLDEITEGDGDAERYKRFCLGRGRGLGALLDGPLPAATAIGVPVHAAGPRRLQVYWLAAREPGTPLENPRQLSAYRYPREYGPQPPSFARAMLPPGAMPLLLSGTAAIVGHRSLHADSTLAQLDETLANFDALLATARLQRPSLPPRFGPGSRLKVYVRDREDLDAVGAALDARLGADVPRIVLHAGICRRELRIEIDGAHG